MSEPTISEIVSTVLRRYQERGVTYRAYGPNRQFKRMMIHRWPAQKIRGAVPYLQASIASSNSLLRRLMRK